MRAAPGFVPPCFVGGCTVTPAPGPTKHSQQNLAWLARISHRMLVLGMACGEGTRRSALRTLRRGTAVDEQQLLRCLSSPRQPYDASGSQGDASPASGVAAASLVGLTWRQYRRVPGGMPFANPRAWPARPHSHPAGSIDSTDPRKPSCIGWWQSTWRPSWKRPASTTTVDYRSMWRKSSTHSCGVEFTLMVFPEHDAEPAERTCLSRFRARRGEYAHRAAGDACAAPPPT